MTRVASVLGLLLLGPALGAAAGEVHGFAELRPTYNLAGGTVDTRSCIQLSYGLRPKLMLYYAQGINFDLDNPNAYGGRRFAVVDGYLGLRALTFWSSGPAGFLLQYEPSVLLPTEELKRSQGLLLGAKQTFTLAKDFGWLALAGSMILSVFGYSRSGSAESGGPAAANPLLETGEEIAANLPIFSPLSLTLAVKFYQRRYASFLPGAINNDVWKYKLARASELTFRFNPSLLLGLAFQTGNFADEDLSGFSIGQAWRNGALQLVVNAAL